MLKDSLSGIKGPASIAEDITNKKKRAIMCHDYCKPASKMLCVSLEDTENNSPEFPLLQNRILYQKALNDSLSVLKEIPPITERIAVDKQKSINFSIMCADNTKCAAEMMACETVDDKEKIDLYLPLAEEYSIIKQKELDCAIMSAHSAESRARILRKTAENRSREVSLPERNTIYSEVLQNSLSGITKTASLAERFAIINQKRVERAIKSALKAETKARMLHKAVDDREKRNQKFLLSVSGNLDHRTMQDSLSSMKQTASIVEEIVNKQKCGDNAEITENSSKEFPLPGYACHKMLLDSVKQETASIVEEIATKIQKCIECAIKSALKADNAEILEKSSKEFSLPGFIYHKMLQDSVKQETASIAEEIAINNLNHIDCAITFADNFNTTGKDCTVANETEKRLELGSGNTL